MRYILFFLSILLFAMPISAQNKINDNFNKRIDALSSQVQDINARYWASRIQNGSLTIEKLEENSKNWLGSDKANKKIISLVKKYLKSGKKVSITDDERKKMDESNSKIREFLKSPEADLKNQTNEQIDAITSPVRDIKARQMALKVNYKQATFEEMDRLSKNWLGSSEENKAVIDLAKKYVKEGKKISITPEEWAKLDESDKKVRYFLDGGKNKSDKKEKKLMKLQKSIFDIEARYWANRIAETKDLTFEDLSKASLNWIGSRAQNQKLINKVEENLKNGNTKKITEKERKKMDAANKQIRLLYNK